MSTFNPKINYFVNTNTGSYVSVSSSIGAFQTMTIASNLEWCKHFMNSQNCINYIRDSSEGVTYQATVSSSSQSNIPILIKSFGPIRLNLDDSGQPNPVVVLLNQSLYSPTSHTVEYSAIIRLYSSDGFSSVSQIGTFSTSSSTTSSDSQTTKWKTFTTNNATYIDPVFNTSSSIIQTKFYTKNPYIFNSRLEKVFDSEGPIFNNNQNGALAFIDIIMTPGTVSDTLQTRIRGLYVREISRYTT